MIPDPPRAVLTVLMSAWRVKPGDATKRARAVARSVATTPVGVVNNASSIAAILSCTVNPVSVPLRRRLRYRASASRVALRDVTKRARAAAKSMATTPLGVIKRALSTEPFTEPAAFAARIAANACP